MMICVIDMVMMALDSKSTICDSTIQSEVRILYTALIYKILCATFVQLSWNSSALTFNSSR